MPAIVTPATLPGAPPATPCLQPALAVCPRCHNQSSDMADRDQSSRSAAQKLGVRPNERIEVVGDVGPGVRDGVKQSIGRGLVRAGELDGAIVLVESLDEAKQALVRYRARLKDSGYLWLVTRKRGHERSPSGSA
jgi:hypothetical protein